MPRLAYHTIYLYSRRLEQEVDRQRGGVGDPARNRESWESKDRVKQEIDQKPTGVKSFIQQFEFVKIKYMYILKFTLSVLAVI